MRNILMTSAMVLAAIILISAAAQASPMLGLTTSSKRDPTFQLVALGTAGGSYNFNPATAGEFHPYNIDTQLFSPNYIDLAASNLSNDAADTPFLHATSGRLLIRGICYSI